MNESISIEARSGGAGSEAATDSGASTWRMTRRAEDVRGGSANGRRAPRIIAIASGKGGVGKSVVASNLAVSAARSGRRCAIVDLDLGCPNLHTLLGTSPGGATLSDFVGKRVGSLSEALTPTAVPNLWLVSGDRADPDAANPVYAQKQKVLRHIRQLDVDEVILDLGAGAAFNVLDFFIAADLGLIIVIPEPTSIENTYHFLKAAVFRALRRAGSEQGVREAIDAAFAQRRGQAVGMRELLAGVFAIDEQAALRLWTEIERFAPALITNQARTAEHRKLGDSIARECQKHLGAQLRHLGALARDERVLESVCSGTPVVRGFPGSAFTRDLAGVSAQLFRAGPPRPVSELAAQPQHTLRAIVEPEPQPQQTPRAIPARPAPAPFEVRDLLEPGRYLRRRREELGLELADLRRKTRIPCLDSIEREDFDRLPPESYVRAFVTQYAREVGIDCADRVAASFIERYRAARGSGQPAVFSRQSSTTPVATATGANPECEAAPTELPRPLEPAADAPSRRQLRRSRRDRLQRKAKR